MGFYAQNKRKGLIVLVLIGCEIINIGIFGYIDLPGSKNLFDKIMSLIITLLSLWVIYIAFRLFISRGNRIVTKHKLRKMYKD